MVDQNSAYYIEGDVAIPRLLLRMWIVEDSTAASLGLDTVLVQTAVSFSIYIQSTLFYRFPFSSKY